MQAAGEDSKYLGLPSLLGRNKSTMLGYLKNKAADLVRSWDMRFISRAGKEVLIKHVAQTLPSFAMSVFLLPLDITKDIERSLVKYWWRGKVDQKAGIHWMSWDRLSKHKSVKGWVLETSGTSI